MVNDRLAQLMALHFSGEATDEQISELKASLDGNPEAQFFYDVFSNYWHLENSEASGDILDEIHFQQIIAIAEKQSYLPPAQPEIEYLPKAKTFSLKKLLVAASFIAVVVLSYILLNTSTPPSKVQDSLNEVIAKAGTRSHMLLPDGSKIWLNSESKLGYNGRFNDSVREVYLEGEAYFDVVKDKNRPFIVHTSDLDIKVLGTAFNVKSYPKESLIEATLIHGMIEVSNKNEPASPKVILRPHDKLVFNKSGNGKRENRQDKNMVAVKPFAITTLPRNINDTVIKETSWVYNKLLFDGETFREIASKMERWYNVKISFTDERIAGVPIHVEFKDESIEEALKALQTIEPFIYKMKDNKIEILQK